MLLLAPQIPLLFMGNDHLLLRAFHFFADCQGDIAKAVRTNRTANFGGVPQGSSEADIPDPNDPETFNASTLDWGEAETEGGRVWAEHVGYLIRVRQVNIVPLLAHARGFAGRVLDAPERCIYVDWELGGRRLQLRANFSDNDIVLPTGLGDRVFSGE